MSTKSHEPPSVILPAGRPDNILLVSACRSGVRVPVKGFQVPLGLI